MANDTPTFKIGSNFYSVAQLFDKSIYANKALVRTDGYYQTYTNVNLKKGDFVGTIYSYSNYGGVTKFLLYGAGGTTNYNSVNYEPTAFSVSALEAQGALTIEEQAKAAAEANKSALDKFFDELGLNNIAKTVAWGLPLFFVGYLGIKLYGAKNEADSLKLRSNDNK
jgi:hypothetical protein